LHMHSTFIILRSDKTPSLRVGRIHYVAYTFYHNLTTIW